MAGIYEIRNNGNPTGESARSVIEGFNSHLVGGSQVNVNNANSVPSDKPSLVNALPKHQNQSFLGENIGTRLNTTA